MSHLLHMHSCRGQVLAGGLLRFFSTNDNAVKQKPVSGGYCFIQDMWRPVVLVDIDAHIDTNTFIYADLFLIERPSGRCRTIKRSARRITGVIH